MIGGVEMSRGSFLIDSRIPMIGVSVGLRLNWNWTQWRSFNFYVTRASYSDEWIRE